MEDLLSLSNSSLDLKNPACKSLTLLPMLLLWNLEGLTEGGEGLGEKRPDEVY